MSGAASGMVHSPSRIAARWATKAALAMVCLGVGFGASHLIERPSSPWHFACYDRWGDMVGYATNAQACEPWGPVPV